LENGAPRATGTAGNIRPALYFFPEGRVPWLIILRAERGQYSVQNTVIRLEITGRPVIEGSFAVTEHSLTLPNSRGSGIGFKRF
jgi:hypothetical protein